MAWVLDLDGVLWRGEQPIEGSAEAVKQLQAQGLEVGYVTNNSALNAQGYVDTLAAMGITATAHDVVHGGHAVARLVSPGQSVLVCAGDGVREALGHADAVLVSENDIVGLAVPKVDAVVVGWRPAYDARSLTLATRAVLGGARLLAPSSDPLYPTADGSVLIGGGALATAVSYATGRDPEFAGKPNQPIIDAIRDRYVSVELIVGDQPRTDGLVAAAMEVPFALVHSGVTAADHGRLQVPIAAEGTNLAFVVEHARELGLPGFDRK